MKIEYQEFDLNRADFIQIIGSYALKSTLYKVESQKKDEHIKKIEEAGEKDIHDLTGQLGNKVEAFSDIKKLIEKAIEDLNPEKKKRFEKVFEIINKNQSFSYMARFKVITDLALAS